MIELIASQMANALRKCGGTIVCDGCPYQSLGAPKCIQQMQKDAAAMIEGQKTVLEQQTQMIAKLRADISNL